MSSESSLNPHVEDIIHEQFAGAPKLTGPLTRFNATVARYGMYLSVAGLLVIVAIVFYQVFGRYVLNSSPTWAENLALVLDPLRDADRRRGRRPRCRPHRHGIAAGARCRTACATGSSS